ncbi:MAG TPA: hypothetical protein VFZ83_01730 [Acidimicrobiia bacterium]|nr:hypothetical protein [Acidimicrobiia bacterium]
MTRAHGSIVDWWFRNRETGAITIGQRPNPPLWVFLAATAVRVVFDPAGDVGTAVRVVGTGALVVWALDELVRGVNPWRRALGAGVVAWQVARLAT